jgi:Heterokaryon incompatibility protein (HET)
MIIEYKNGKKALLFSNMDMIAINSLANEKINSKGILLFNTKLNYLEYYTWKNIPPYIAVSHVWGNQNNICSIIYDNEICYIGDNCINSFLRAVDASYNLKINFIWFDILCIPQNKVELISKQIKHMDNIYLQASKVIILLVDFIMSKKELNLFKKTINSKKMIQNIDMHMNGYKIVDDEIRSKNNFLNKAFEFSADEWNLRVWTFQECALSIGRRIWITCDNTYLETEDIRILYILVTTMSYNSTISKKAFNFWKKYEKYLLYNAITLGYNIDLILNKHPLWIFGCMSSKICTKPQDIVYGIMGCIPEKLRIQVDYKLDAETVILNFSIKVLNILNDRQILAYNGNCNITNGGKLVPWFES